MDNLGRAGQTSDVSGLKVDGNCYIYWYNVDQAPWTGL